MRVLNDATEGTNVYKYHFRLLSVNNDNMFLCLSFKLWEENRIYLLKSVFEHVFRPLSLDQEVSLPHRSSLLDDLFGDINIPVSRGFRRFYLSSQTGARLCSLLSFQINPFSGFSIYSGSI